MTRGDGQQMNNIITIQSVRGYIAEDATVWLNVEDVARGLGFTETAASGNVTIRWRTVRSYLESFGYTPIAGSCDDIKAGDYIPENMFYRLAMKAKNAIAEAFQAKVADEILPTIRKTGSYTTQVSALTPIRASLEDIEFASAKIQELFAVKRGIALAEAIEFVETNSNLNLNNLKKLLPPAEHETGYLNATQIGERLGGIPPRIVNKMLAAKGMEYKIDGMWRLTEDGKEYGEEVPYTRNGHSGYQIRWSERVMELFGDEGATA